MKGLVVGEGDTYEEVSCSPVCQDSLLVRNPSSHGLRGGLDRQTDEKFRALMASVGLGEYCQDIDALDVDLLIAQFLELEKIAEPLEPSCAKRRKTSATSWRISTAEYLGVRVG